MRDDDATGQELHEPVRDVRERRSSEDLSSIDPVDVLTAEITPRIDERLPPPGYRPCPQFPMR